MAEENSGEENTTKKKTAKSEKAEMSFLEHLEALRWHIIKSILAICIFATLAYIYSDFIWNSILLAPNRNDFWTSRILIKLNSLFGVKSLGLNKKPVDLINFDLSGQFIDR